MRVQGSAGEMKGEAHRNEVTAGYFQLLQTPVIAGRDFSGRDTPSVPRVAVVNETFARRYFGGISDALGGTVVDGKQEFEVVGVVGSSKQYTLREEFGPIFYTAASQEVAPGLTVRYVIRSRMGATYLKEPIRAALHEFDPTAAVRSAELDEMAADSMLRERLMASLSTFFGAIALTLAAVGVYEVVSYTAATRRREIGIRIALGARASHVVHALLGRVVVAVTAGLLLGLVLARTTGAASASLLYGVAWRDPRVLVVIVAVIVCAAIAAAALPARRALRTDPVAALRVD